MDANQLIESVADYFLWEQEQAGLVGDARRERVHAALQSIRECPITQPEEIEAAARELGHLLEQAGQKPGSIKARKSDFRFLVRHKHRIDTGTGWRANVDAIHAAILSTRERLEMDMNKARLALETARKKYQDALSAWNEWQMATENSTSHIQGKKTNAWINRIEIAGQIPAEVTETACTGYSE